MFYVIDATGNVSYDDEGNHSEWFDREKTALDRAEELAAAAPGETFTIAKAIFTVTTPVGKPEAKPA